MKAESNPTIYAALIGDLHSAYWNIVQENTRRGIVQTRHQVCLHLSQLPAPRFYVSLSYAKRIINSMSRGLPRVSRHRYLLHRDIYTRWLSLPESERTDSAILGILSQPAPSYYLSAVRISKLLYKK